MGIICKPVRLKAIAFLFPFFSLIYTLGLAQPSANEPMPCHCEWVDTFKMSFPLYASRGDMDSIRYVLQFFEQSTNPYCHQTFYHWWANVNNYQSNYDSTWKNLKSLRAELDKTPCERNEAMYHDIMGSYYVGRGNLDSASIAYIAQLKVLEKLGIEHNIATVLVNLGFIFTKLGQHEKSFQYYQQALPMVLRMDIPWKKTSLLGSIASGYDTYGNTDSSLAYVRDSSTILAKITLQEAKACNNTNAISESLSLLGTQSILQKQFRNALVYFDEQLKFLDPQFHSRSITNCHMNRADAYIGLRQFDMAAQALDSSEHYQNITGLKLNQVSLLEKRYQVAKQTGNFAAALAAYEQYTSLKDSLTGEEKFNTINELEGKYQSELKEAQIKDLAQQQEIDALRIRGLGFGIAAAGLALLLILFFYRQSTLRNRQRAIETELRLNRARMDPHFFFNALGSIQTLAMKEGSLKTADFLSKFARIMRQSLESTYQDQVTVEKEIEFLTRYLDLQKMRFPGKFNYHIDLSADLDPEGITLPSMILQPFVENAIEHGFKSIDYPGEIQIRFQQKAQSLEIEVVDNGKFFQDETKHKEYPSRATQIIRDRLFLLQKQTHRPASFEIKPGNAQQGYHISIHLPLIPAKT